MEVAERAEGPFSRRNVQEWSRLDQLTGLLEHARVETDHWTASTSNSSHHFGKVVDSRSRSLAGGGQEQRQQTKQLEVFQASVPGGSVQVIRSSTSSTRQTHKIDTPSKRRHGRWQRSVIGWHCGYKMPPNDTSLPSPVTSLGGSVDLHGGEKVLSGGSGWIASDRLPLPSSEIQGFDHLKLTLNPLDLSSQKTRASVGRSGSIGSRRPPSRPRSITSTKNEDVPEQVDGSQLTELSRKFHQETRQDSNLVGDSPILNGFSSDQNDNILNDKAKESQQYETTSSLINGLSRNVSKSKYNPTILNSQHLSLIRKKSCSSEDLHVVDEEGNDTDSNTSEWKRSSKVRRSLQFPPKPSQVQKETIVVPVTKSVSEIKKEIENRKQLVTSSFRTNQWEHLSELEGVLGAVKNGIHEDDQSKNSSNSSDVGTISSSKTKKRQTFITVESLKEVKGRLRKLNSPDDEGTKNDDVDDGIVTEVRSSSPTIEVIDDTPKSSVKSYIFGMEVMLRKSKPAFIGTGSLESRTTNKSLTNGNNRSEEWYNRRKSYGFEQVGNQQNNDYTSFEKSKIESSTDSGICRSSDTFSSWQKLEKPTTNQSGPIKTSHSIVIKPYQNAKNNTNEVEVDAVVQKGRKTVVNLTSNTSNTSWTWKTENSEPNPSDVQKEILPTGKIADAIKSLREKSTPENQRLSDPITISIPIQQTTKCNLTDSTSLLLKQSTPLGAVETSNTSISNELTPYSELLYGKDTPETSTLDNESYFENIPWRGSRTKALSNFFDSEFKRHSIAVDQTKYLTHKKTYGSYCFNENRESDVKERKQEPQRNSLDIFNHRDKEINKGGESDHELNYNEKKQKKVEFCKTEVHFAAEPGRFNIVETDGKPPPSNMFRRRRKTTSDAPNRSGLPEIRFGDTQYEKNMLSIREKVSPSQNLTAFRSSPIMYNNDENDSLPSTYSAIESKPTTTETTFETEFSKQFQEEQTYSEDETPKPRSILKNNIPKPKSYLLGEWPDLLIGEESKSWGVKLKSVKVEDDSQKWDQDPQAQKETEFQKLLRSLRPATSKPTDLFELPSQMKQSSTATDNGLEVRITSSTFPPDLRRASWSVADRIKSVEEAKGYSTKVNFGPQETTVVKLDDLTSCSTPSQGLKSSWLIKEQNSTFDVRPAEQLKSGMKLMHSQSFNQTASQSLLGSNKNNCTKHILKSTSLVMEVQNPNINLVGEFEKKISARETSTNLTRDISERNSQRLKQSSKSQRNSASEKVERYCQQLNTFHKDVSKKVFSFEINTKTIPPVKKTSSATQTYFVTRSLLRNNSSREKLKTVGKENESMNGIPGVLHALDDLSRSIDEVIIDSPQRFHNKDCSNSKSVFKVKEDFKRVPNPDNVHHVAADKPTIMSQLDLLRDMVDLGELSEDSLKADEEVRAYMSADNDEDSEWSGSWSRVRAFRQRASKGMDSRTSPSVGSTAHPPLNHRQGADAVNSTSGPPRVTSIALLHPATARTPPHFADKHPTPPSGSYTSKNLLNSSGITSKIELSTNGERTWSFSKGSENNSTVTPNENTESDFLGELSKQSFNHDITGLVLQNNSSPSKFSRNSHSPSKETLLCLERSAERNIVYNNENNQQMSTTPTSGRSRKVTSLVNIKLETYQNNLGKNEPNYLVKPSNSCVAKEVNHPINISNHKLEEKVEFSKKLEMKNPSNDVKSKERKFSSSSSGRDGWLNTPKEVQVRRKVEHITRPQSSKKETKVSEKTKKVSSLKHIHKRTESPIYQNREIYSERQDSNDNTETESTILEELTKAADQILLAVNGYTDDDSFRASSEDESRKKRENLSNQPLCTISEVPNKKNNISKTSSRQSMGVIKSTRSNDLRRELRISSKVKSGVASSNSSMESVPIPDVRPILSSEDRNKRRAARLLQRASSRELLFQSAASSSEDIGSGSDTSSLRNKRVFRRPRVHNGKKSTSATANESRTSERVQRTTALLEVDKNLKTKVQTENRCSRQSKTTSGSASGVRRERRPAVVTHGSRTQKKTPETSQSERKSGNVSQAK